MPASRVGQVLAVAWILFVLFLVFHVMAELWKKRNSGGPGLTPNRYILATIFVWGVEIQVLRITALGTGYKAAPFWRLNWWAPFTLWWPPEFLKHPAASGSEIVVAVLGAALAVGVVLNVLRLRNASLPRWIATLALVPFVNLALFLFLAITPSRKVDEQRMASWKDRLLPRDALSSALVSCVLTAFVGLMVAEFGIDHFGTYGWTLFAAGPVVMGFVAAVIYCSAEPRSSDSCIYVAMGSVILIGLAFIGFALEGLACILMAAPIALPLAALGGWFGYLVQRRSEQTPQFAGALLLLPFMMYGEKHVLTDARQIAVSTSIVIHAPANRVWTSVVRLSSVPKPESPIFHSVAYPIKTTLEGAGTGARRQCVFSTGSIVEPIEVWSPGKELRFAVVSQPPLMRELTPYSDVHPPHLKLEYLRSKEGQFTLSAQPDGSTLLTGTSYYESRLWPGEYWQIWTDAIAHTVHRVVLAEIKRQAER